MPSVNIKQIVDSRPLSFTIKTKNGQWECMLHSDRAAYERSRVSRAPASPTPGITRSDSGLSTTSTRSSSSSVSSSSSSSH
ncbi:uncharacterized protein GGS25DRAFT_496679 [Hypoxylon fragiforme]|uniref:uncharacterized protein n=1 Tax=Hypoxylon fragiforme TaxID=63214 RepID=UPI0020C650FB|nr:uncharacterized protein GGS25DRAFT_496679 [Hypoxylon fragiforme]KAI2607588.1 hypothetical protein GGS25DRAFT_496679 [Hypoxylon fragiforme]